MPAAESTRKPVLRTVAVTAGRVLSPPEPWSLGWRMWRWEPFDLVVGSALVVLLVLVVGVGPAIAPGVPLALATPVLWRVDVAERRLPNSLLLPIGYLAFGGLVALGLSDGSVPIAPVVSLVGTFLFFLILNLGGGMGMGDVKLAVALAGVLALVRDDAVVAAAVVAFVAGGVAALVVHVRARQRSIPFGPFLLVGFWVALALSR